jgi:putative colanic acid biosynthesis acetyltransferase WcaF
MYLSKFKKTYKAPNIIYRTLWYCLGQPIFSSRFLVSSKLRAVILHIFGTKVGYNVVLRAGIKIKNPRELIIGDNTWIGESVWIENVGRILIGNNVCISQDAFLCSGNHDWSKDTFDLLEQDINIADHVWIGARANIAPNVTIAEGVVVTMGSSVFGNLAEWGVYSGNPAKKTRERPKTI